MKNIACFDVGGTFIKYAIIDSMGNILLKSKFETPNHNCRIEVPERISMKIEELRSNYEINGIGICTPGNIDFEKGIVLTSSNLPEYDNCKMCEYIKEKTGFQPILENDGNAAAIGEMWMGSAKGLENFVFITLGTGVGGAIIINKKLVRGINGGAGEVGHIIINEEGEKCGCGVTGCYEKYASTSSFIRQYVNKAIVKGQAIEELRNIDGEEIMKRVKAGETIALETYDEFLEHVVTGLVTFTHLLDPGLIVVGGGISAQGKCFIEDLNDKFKKRVISEYARYTSIVASQLKNDAGIFGCCYLALQ